MLANVGKQGIALGAGAAGIVMSLAFGWMVDTFVELLLAGAVVYLLAENQKLRGG